MHFRTDNHYFPSLNAYCNLMKSKEIYMIQGRKIYYQLLKLQEVGLAAVELHFSKLLRKTSDSIYSMGCKSTDNTSCYYPQYVS